LSQFFPLNSPRDRFVVDGAQHDQDADHVKEAVSDQGPPVEVGHRPGAQGAHADHEHDVENSRADHSTHADVILKTVCS